MSKKRAGDDDWQDALFAAPPRAFVAERKRVVAELKSDGRSEDARAAAKMKRPSASVWAINQLARQAPDELAELLALGASLRAGERKLMRGGHADDFMTEARTARQRVAALARRAETALGEAGHKATLTLGRKIAQTIHAASIGDDETRRKLQAGRLQQDLAPPSSFGGDSSDLSAALTASVGGRAKTQAAHAERKRAEVERKRAEVVRNRAGGRHDASGDAARTDGTSAHAHHGAAANARRRAAAERKQAAAALRDERRAQAAARKQAAALNRAAAVADRLVAERKRAVERARAAVERAETELRAAKDALTDAETEAAAAHRVAEADGARR